MEKSSVYMLNALWFKHDGGAESYKKYLAAAGKVVEELGIGAKMLDKFVPREMLIGDWNPDLFFVMEYPSREAFERLVNSEPFKQIRHLREAALEKSLLIECQKL